jgi:hypothetical protein
MAIFSTTIFFLIPSAPMSLASRLIQATLLLSANECFDKSKQSIIEYLRGD